MCHHLTYSHTASFYVLTVIQLHSPTCLLLNILLKDSYPEFPTLDTSTEQETVEKMEDGKKGEESPHKCQNDIHEDCNSLSNEEERHSNTEPLQVEQCKSTGNEKALEEKRGVKRKRNDDDDDDDNDDCKVNSESLHETQGKKVMIIIFYLLLCLL